MHLDADFTGELSASLFDDCINTAVAHQAAAAGLAEKFRDAQNAVHEESALATALVGAGVESPHQSDLEVPDSPDAKPASAQTVDEHVESVVLIARRAADDATEAADEAQKTEANVLGSVGVPSLEALTQVIAGALAHVKVFERDLTEARRQIPIAADLSRRIDTLEPLVDALDEMNGLMTNGNFPAAAIEQRQARFLELATDRLLDMTERRFGFAADFRIVVALTSQARDAKTLSGGETFLASLALALAVVDLAGRAGGSTRPSSTDALNQALDTLAQQTMGRPIDRRDQPHGRRR